MSDFSYMDCMNITGLVLWVADATVSHKFYKKLGFSLNEVTDRHATASCGKFEAQLITMRDEDEFNKDSLSSKKGEGMYLYVQVEDVDKKYNDIVKLGLEASSKPRNWEWGNREFVVKDPDGYKICFFQPIVS